MDPKSLVSAQKIGSIMLCFHFTNLQFEWSCFSLTVVWVMVMHFYEYLCERNQWSVLTYLQFNQHCYQFRLFRKISFKLGIESVGAFEIGASFWNCNLSLVICSSKMHLFVCPGVFGCKIAAYIIRKVSCDSIASFLATWRNPAKKSSRSSDSEDVEWWWRRSRK